MILLNLLLNMFVQILSSRLDAVDIEAISNIASSTQIFSRAKTRKYSRNFISKIPVTEDVVIFCNYEGFFYVFFFFFYDLFRRRNVCSGKE